MATMEPTGPTPSSSPPDRIIFCLRAALPQVSCFHQIWSYVINSLWSPSGVELSLTVLCAPGRYLRLNGALGRDRNSRDESFEIDDSA
jgi:hypothetical protein